LQQTASHRDGFGPTIAKAFGYEESPTEALEQRLREATLAKDWELVGRLQPALWASSITGRQALSLSPRPAHRKVRF
jgi:hypothetical protein